MKKLLFLCILCFAFIGRSQTNLVVSNFVGTVDINWTNQVIPKLNYNNGQLVQWLNDHNATNAAEDSAISNLTVTTGILLTNSTKGVTNFSLAASSLTPSSSPTVTVVGVTNNIAYFAFGIPAASTSNVVVSASSIVLINTNFNFAYSNYVGVFTNVSLARANGPVLGGGGLTPGTNATCTLSYSTTGTSGWTTNLPGLPNVLYVAVTCVSTGGVGLVHLDGVINANAFGNTNDLTQETTYVPSAIDARSPVPLSQLNIAISQLSTFMWNGTNYAASFGGQKMIEANAPVPLFSTNLSLVVDGTGTNLALTIATANIQANSALVMSTNLILGLAGFQTFTGGYTTSTAGGNKTWTIPMYEVPASYAFFQVAAFGAGTLQSDYPLTAMQGIFYPSNNWNLPAITNAMYVAGVHWVTVNSNDQKLVDVQISNNVVYLHPHM